MITCNTGAAAQALIDTANFGGVDVANMSLGTFNPDPALESAVNYATSRDLLVVAAAGNDARIDPFYPAAYSNAIAVSSTSFGDTGSDFSDFGEWVDISAPGGFDPNVQNEEDILSTYPQFAGSFKFLDGTSMASPYVAGVAALLAAQGKNASQIRTALESTATDLGPCGRDITFGAGRLDAAAALGVASPQANCIPLPPAGDPEACAKAKKKLARARAELKSAKKNGDRRKVQDAKKAVKKAKKLVKKVCG